MLAGLDAIPWSGIQHATIQEISLIEGSAQMIISIRFLLGILATVGATYAAPVLFHLFRALSLIQIG